MEYHTLGRQESTSGSVRAGDQKIIAYFNSYGGKVYSFDGCSPMSIAVMENCSIHHTEDVAELFQNAGILQPRYKPK